MFFAGSMGEKPEAKDYTGRGGAYVYYGNNPQYFIAPRFACLLEF